MKSEFRVTSLLTTCHFSSVIDEGKGTCVIGGDWVKRLLATHDIANITQGTQHLSSFGHNHSKETLKRQFPDPLLTERIHPLRTLNA